MNQVFILSLFDTGLYAAQLIGRQGVTVRGFDHVDNAPGFFSKYIQATLVTNPAIDNGVDVLNTLLSKAKVTNQKPVLLASSELYLNFIHENRLILEEYFIISLPVPKVLENIINKVGQFEMAKYSEICVPKYSVVNDNTDLENLINEKFEYPLIIKGNAQQKWKSAELSKSYIAKDFEELYSTANNLLKKEVSFIIQHIVTGPILNNYEYNALVIDGKIIESVVIRKVRQYPAPYGAATCIETCKNDKIENLGRRFVLDNRIEGFSNTEFKIDTNTGTAYFIETNARVWLQIKHTKSLGQNFLRSFYNVICHGDEIKLRKYSFKKIKWVDPFGDLMYLFRVNRSFSGFFSVIASYHNARSFGLIDISDIKPFFKSIKNIFHKL